MVRHAATEVLVGCPEQNRTNAKFLILDIPIIEPAPLMASRAGQPPWPSRTTAKLGL